MDLDVPTVYGQTKERSAAVQRAEPSYMPTGVAFLDSLLELADRMTAGKAGVLQRAVSYLIVGGFAATVNLICLYILYDIVRMPFATTTHYVVAFVIAAEISILANFIPNDRITFSRLPGHARSWWQRCWRFHTTAIAGTLVTFTISFGLKLGLHFHTIVAQSIAIIIALVFNFTFHHIWTYRHIKPAH
jgi:dolichol-phosphate mannosyltransferase